MLKCAGNRWRALAGLLTLTATLVHGCGGCRDTSSDRLPPGSDQRPAEEGIASHYADRFAGRKTASGARYDPSAMTAAHRTLPLGTVLRVTRIDRRGATVAGPIVVRVNDRGPYSKGRIIDLSAAAARKLGMLGDIARVRLQVISQPGARTDGPGP